MSTINKLTAPTGTTAVVANPDVTAWILSGWTTVEQYDVGHMVMRKV